MDRKTKKRKLLTGKAWMKSIAKGILENQLGIEPSEGNIRRLASHLIVFEKKLERRRREKISRSKLILKNNTHAHDYLKQNFREGAHWNDYLSLRELEIFLGLLQGQPSRTIAKQLSLSPRSIEFYIENMILKFHCQNKKGLILFLKKLNLY